MSPWWQRRSRRVWLALGFALGGDAVLALSVAAGFGLKLWQFMDPRDALPVLALGGAVVTLLFLGLGYVISGWALAPVRETIELARRFSTQSGRQQIAVTNPHDEIGELEFFLNELLQRLEGSFVELDRFAADVSHELRTPLTAMRSVGEVALRERNPAILYDAVGSMLEEIRRMNQLIDRLLLLTRGDSDKWPVRPKPGLVRNALTEVCETLGMVAEEKQQRLRVICADDLKAVFDPALLRLALMNLTQNAIRYSPLDKAIVLRGTDNGKAVVIEVADEGPGIAPEHREKIFQRFYRVDAARARAEGGVGLGLAIVKWSVERMGGTVELESEVGRGSTFRIHLMRVVS
jgi:signal transduction histidine kinase